MVHRSEVVIEHGPRRRQTVDCGSTFKKGNNERALIKSDCGLRTVVQRSGKEIMGGRSSRATADCGLRFKCQEKERLRRGQ